MFKTLFLGILNFFFSKQFGKEYFIALRLTDKVLRNHLIKRLEECKFNIKEKDYKIVVRNDKSSEWLPDSSLSNNLKAIARRVNYMGKPIETEITIDSEKYLLLGIKSTKIRGYSFYALYP